MTPRTMPIETLTASTKKFNFSLKKDPALWSGTFLVAFLVLAAFIGPVLSPLDAYDTSTNVLAAPNADHILGTDSVGRDIFARITLGLQSSLMIVFASALIAVTIGTSFGLLAAYFSNRVDWVIMRIVDILLAVPTLLLAVAVLAALGPSSLTLILILGVTFIPHTSRVIRASALRVVQQEFTTSAVISGMPWIVIIFRHVLPNVRGILFVQTAVTLANMLVVETALSFLGLGIPPPTPSIGYIIAEGRQWMEIAPLPVLSGSLVIVFLILGITMIGQGLDHKLSRKQLGN